MRMIWWLLLVSSNIWGQALFPYPGPATASIGSSITILQQKGGTGTTRCDNNGATTTTVTCSFNTTPTAGNLIVVTTSHYNFSNAVTAAITDNQGNGTYSLDANIQSSTSHNEASVFHKAQAASSGTYTITLTLSAATYAVVHIYEVSLTTASPLDQTGTNSSNGPSATASITLGSTTTNTEIIFGAFAYAGATTANTASAGFTLGEVTSNVATTVMGLQDVFRTTSATGVFTPGVTFGITETTGYGGAAGTYK